MSKGLCISKIRRSEVVSNTKGAKSWKICGNDLEQKGFYTSLRHKSAK